MFIASKAVREHRFLIISLISPLPDRSLFSPFAEGGGGALSRRVTDFDAA